MWHAARWGPAVGARWGGVGWGAGLGRDERLGGWGQVESRQTDGLRVRGESSGRAGVATGRGAYAGQCELADRGRLHGRPEARIHPDVRTLAMPNIKYHLGSFFLWDGPVLSLQTKWLER